MEDSDALRNSPFSPSTHRYSIEIIETDILHLQAHRIEKAILQPLSLVVNSSKMPKSNTIIAAPMREALAACFSAVVSLVSPSERHQLVLVSGSASVVHSSRLKTEDIDVAAPSGLVVKIWSTISDGVRGFSVGMDGKIRFEAPQGFGVNVDLIKIGQGCIDHLIDVEPYLEASVASKSDLLRLRAVTVVDRGSDGEIKDFKWLLAKVAQEGVLLPAFDKDESECLRKAAGMCLSRLECLVLGALLCKENSAMALSLISS